MPVAPARAREHVERLVLDDVPRREQRGGVEVALERARFPTRSQPSSSGVRASIPIASPPASAIAPSSSPVPTPKWIVGTPRSAIASNSRRMWGCTAER